MQKNSALASGTVYSVIYFRNHFENNKLFIF